MSTAVRAFRRPVEINQIGTGVAVVVQYGEDIQFRGMHVLFQGEHFVVCNLNGIGLVVHRLEPLHVNRVVMLKEQERDKMLDRFAEIGHYVVGSEPIGNLVVHELFHCTAPSAV